MAEERGVDRARRELRQERNKADDDFARHMGKVLAAGVKLKKVMVEKGLGAAKANCPLCGGAGSLHGRLITGKGAGRHRSSGGAFRMWCSAPGCGAQMME